MLTLNCCWIGQIIVVVVADRVKWGFIELGGRTYNYEAVANVIASQFS